MRALAIIPARYAAQRFPGKPLATLGGKPVIQHVYERTVRARGLAGAVVATDDDGIAAVVRAFGGEVAMTSPDHPSGTDRAAEVARGRPDVDVVLNVQGDEPFVEPASLEALLAALERPGAEPPRFATLCAPLRPGELEEPNVVKVVLSRAGDALYFSRAPLAASRAPFPAESVRRHVGLYGFRREALLWYASLAPTPLERGEGLEQLRILKHGARLAVAEAAPGVGIAIDTPEDLARARRHLEAAHREDDETP